MILNESLEASGHIKNVLLLFNSKYDSWDILFQIILNELNVNFHMCL